MSKYFEVEVSEYTFLTSKIEVKVSKSEYTSFEIRSISKSKSKFFEVEFEVPNINIGVAALKTLMQGT